MTCFVTARLVATPLSLADVALYERLWGDERVGQFLGGIRSRDQARDAVLAGMEHWREHGFGRWVIRADGTPVGTVKLAVWNGLGSQDVELGYALLPDAWGQGYATEAAAGALDLARTALGLSEVVAFTLPENQASRAVMRRLGFEEERQLLLGGREHVLSRRRLG